MSLNKFVKLVGAVVVCEMAGVVGSIFTTPSIPGWYSSLTKPAINPPSWVFAPVWTTLFLLMGIAVFLVWNKGLKDKKTKIALTVFGVQLVLNTLWSIIFFGYHQPGWAFAEIIVLWLAIFISIVYFAKISRLAAWLLVPYILWVSFASYLNFSIWDLNKAVFETQIANPASVNCTKNGGQLVIQKNPTGGEYGLCFFDDARACEEWAMMRGECPVGGVKTTGYDTDAQKYCAWVGGQTLAVPGAICNFKDKSTCPLDKLFDGDCQKGENI